MFNNKFSVLLKHPGYNDMGTAIGAGVSIVGSMMDSSGDSADAANSGLNQAISTLKSVDDRTRTDTQPYRDLGAGASGLLAKYLGISSPVQHVGASDLVHADANGNFVPNAAMYASDPAYKQAFDSAMAAHQAKYGTTPNLSKGSNLDQFMGYDTTGYNASLDAKSGQ